MQALFGSLFGFLGTPQLHTVILLGMLTIATFRPERIGSWAMFRLSLVLFVVAVALPGVGAALPGEGKVGDLDRLVLQVVMPASGLLTGATIYCLVTSISSTGRAAAS